jgi:peptidyl-prolyl cis-trans isomerase A (cyclophilin A)
MASAMDRRQLLAALTTLASLGPAHSPANAQAAASVRTRVTTEFGAFTIEVVPAIAPITVANYLAYVDGRHLDGTTVYRLVNLANQSPETPYKIEVVQWGVNQPEDKPPPFPPIRHETTRETGLRHRDGTVAMARSAPGSAAGEFFICIGDQPELDFGGHRNPDGQGFAAFGQVVEGMEVVRALHAKAGPQQFLERPFAVQMVRRIG